MNRILIFIFLAIFSFTGCSTGIFNLGKNKTKCEEEGCNYADAGICMDALDVLNNKEAANANSYNNISCQLKIKKIEEEANDEY